MIKTDLTQPCKACSQKRMRKEPPPHSSGNVMRGIIYGLPIALGLWLIIFAIWFLLD